jgi:Transposase DDE domain group 1
MRHWPKTRIVWRGHSHYGRVEAMDWAEGNDTDYIVGLDGNAVLDALVAEIADNLRFHHVMSRKAKLRCELHVSGHQLEAAAQGGGSARMLTAARRSCSGAVALTITGFYYRFPAFLYNSA